MCSKFRARDCLRLIAPYCDLSAADSPTDCEPRHAATCVHLSAFYMPLCVSSSSCTFTGGHGAPRSGAPSRNLCGVHRSRSGRWTLCRVGNPHEGKEFGLVATALGGASVCPNHWRAHEPHAICPPSPHLSPVLNGRRLTATYRSLSSSLKQVSTVGVRRIRSTPARALRRWEDVWRWLRGQGVSAVWNGQCLARGGCRIQMRSRLVVSRNT